MNCEVHFAYSALNNVANLHVIMAIPNCEWFEVLSFNRAGDHDLEHLNYGLAEPIEIDSDGFGARAGRARPGHRDRLGPDPLRQLGRASMTQDMGQPSIRAGLAAAIAGRPQTQLGERSRA